MSWYFPILNDGVSSLEPGVSGTKAQTIIVFLRRRIKKQFSKTVTFYFISGSSNARRPGIFTRAGFPKCKLQPPRGAPGSRGIFERVLKTEGPLFAHSPSRLLQTNTSAHTCSPVAPWKSREGRHS